MEMSFGRRGIARPNDDLRLPVLPIDYPSLLATLAAAQAATPTARVATRAACRDATVARPVDALVTLLVPGRGWSQSVRLLGGSFSPPVPNAADRSPRQPT